MPSSVTVSGPMFNGMAAHAVHEFVDKAERTVAERAEQEVQTRLGSVLKHPTGHYQSTIHVAGMGDGQEVLDGTVYGPWLEGTGSRNATTRFKGYRTFRLTTQRVQGQADSIAQGVLRPYLARMQ